METRFISRFTCFWRYCEHSWSFKLLQQFTIRISSCLCGIQLMCHEPVSGDEVAPFNCSRPCRVPYPDVTNQNLTFRVSLAQEKRYWSDSKKIMDQKLKSERKWIFYTENRLRNHPKKNYNFQEGQNEWEESYTSRRLEERI